MPAGYGAVVLSADTPASAAPRPVQVTHARVVGLALPMTLAHVSTPLLGTVDAAVIGRLGEAHLLGAIAAGAVVFDFVFWVFGFLRMGTAGLTAQAVGAGDDGEQRAGIQRALVVGVLLGVAVVALQGAIATLAFGAMGASPAVTAAARTYFDVRIWSAPFTFVNYVVLGAVIGRGRTDLGLALQVAINLVNIGVNIALVTGLGLGVRGSALGTLTAEAMGTAAGLVLLVRLDRAIVVIDWPRIVEPLQIRRMFVTNRDIMIRTTALIFAFGFFTSQGARGGDVTLAANAVLMNLFMVSAFFLDGFATAAEQMCGQSVGARDPHGFGRAVRLTLAWCFAFAAALSALVLMAGGSFIDLVTTSEAVRQAARTELVWAALTPLLAALAFEFDGVFIGAMWTRDMRNLMLVALALYLAAFAALRPLGNLGLWLALLVFLSARGLLQAWRYPALFATTFPAAQPSAPAPTASARRA